MFNPARAYSQLVLFKKTDVTTTSTGEAIDAFQPLFVFSGSIVNNRNTYNHNQSINGPVQTDTISFYCRAIHNLNTKDYRIAYNDELYTIVSIQFIHRHEMIIELQLLK